MDPKAALLLLNVGTPDSPSITDVRKYLSDFLNDKRVIDLPWLLRKVLVNMIIIPFRAPKSAKLYTRLWTEAGSPLLVHALSLREKLQKKAGGRYIVMYASNYGQPNVEKVMEELIKMNVTRILAFPMFPQYASSTTGSVMEKIHDIISKQYNMPAISTIGQYYDSPHYVDALFSVVSEYDYMKYDHILMSFHGLPLSQVRKAHLGKSCRELDCENKVTPENSFCYLATCFASARILAGKLKLDEDRYTVCFQSRLTQKWLRPFTGDILKKLANEGKKNVLVICPSFTSDCLETNVEVGQIYRNLFIEEGGMELTVVRSLNDSDKWAEAIFKIIELQLA